MTLTSLRKATRLDAPEYRAVARLMLALEMNERVDLTPEEARALLSLRDLDTLAKDIPYLVNPPKGDSDVR